MPGRDLFRKKPAASVTSRDCVQFKPVKAHDLVDRLRSRWEQQRGGHESEMPHNDDVKITKATVFDDVGGEDILVTLEDQNLWQYVDHRRLVDNHHWPEDFVQARLSQRQLVRLDAYHRHNIGETLWLGDKPYIRVADHAMRHRLRLNMVIDEGCEEVVVP